jgi:hypothetical protein
VDPLPSFIIIYESAITMKNKIKSISLSALLVIALATVVIAKVNSLATVQNNSTYNLGTVTINAGGSPYYVNVPGKGTFYVNVPALPAFVVINNQVVSQGQYGIVVLPTGKKIKATLSGYIVVTDQQEGV